MHRTEVRAQREPEPIILATDPEEVMWNSLIYAAVAALLSVVLTHGFH